MLHSPNFANQEMAGGLCRMAEGLTHQCITAGAREMTPSLVSEPHPHPETPRPPSWPIF